MTWSYNAGRKKYGRPEKGKKTPSELKCKMISRRLSYLKLEKYKIRAHFFQDAQAHYKFYKELILSNFHVVLGLALYKLYISTFLLCPSTIKILPRPQYCSYTGYSTKYSKIKGLMFIDACVC